MPKREYKLIECRYSDELSRVVMQHLAEGWDCWGNPFAQEAEYDGDVRDIHYFQAVTRFQYEPGEMIKGEVMETTDKPAAGYAVMTPEFHMESARLPECCCFEYTGDNPHCLVHPYGPAVPARLQLALGIAELLVERRQRQNSRKAC